MAGGRKGRRLSKDEHVLWRGVTRAIAPLRKAVAPAEPELEEDGQARASPRRAVSRAPVPASAAVKPKPLPPLAPLERRMKHKLARGTQKIDARLDLHGFTQAEAHAALLHFLRKSQDKGAGFALVITGKGARGDAGRGEGERGVLKRSVPMWLRLPEFRDYVVGFEQASIPHGGEGALYVRVRRARS